MVVTAITAQIESLATQLQTFRLFHRFSMPVGDHAYDAVAVTIGVSKELTSLYSIMLHMIILEIWALVVLFVLAIVVRKNVTHNVGVVNVSIWNSQSSPLSVIQAVLNYREHIPLYAFGWALLALIAWAGSIAMSTFVAPFLVIDLAAPVNASAVYVPYVSPTASNSLALQLNALEVPSNLRAIDVLETATKTGQNDNATSNNVIIYGGEVGSEFGFPVYQINYTYTVLGSDFGLQKAPGLMHKVQGSCITEYGWLVNSSAPNDIPTDKYQLFGENKTATVSTTDGKPPLVTVYQGPSSPPNNKFALVVSSLGRLSFTSSEDPWYNTTQLTTPILGASFIVRPERPVLSCQQQDLWSYKGLTKSIADLDQLPDLSPAMVFIFKSFLSQPRIIELVQSLGSKALKSAATSQGLFFDAGSSSLQSDLQRLILGAYIATKNTLAETTLFNAEQYPSISNGLIDPATNQQLAGAGDFVIFNSAYAALSVRVLIVVPTILALLFVLVLILSDSTPIRMPWGYVNSLRASVLYTAVDTEHYRPGAGDWEGGVNPYMAKDEPAHVRPDLKPTKRGSYSWKHTNEPAANGENTTATVEEKEAESPGPKE